MKTNHKAIRRIAQPQSGGLRFRTHFVFAGDWGGASTSLKKRPSRRQRFGRFYAFVATDALLASFVNC